MFSVPTYTFIILIASMIVYGLFLVVTKGPEAIAVPSSHEEIAGLGTLRSSCSRGPSPPAVRR